MFPSLTGGMVGKHRINMYFNIILPTILVSYGLSAPVGPNYDNIQYAHNFSVAYQNGQVQGLDQIDSFNDVDAQMAQSLKEAINRAVPGYVENKQNVQTSTQSSTYSTANGNHHAEEVTIGVSTEQPHNIHRRAADMQTTESSSIVPTTQPYGTDEEFYARTDLIHFHVDIDLPEGSGEGSIPLPDGIINV